MLGAINPMGQVPVSFGQPQTFSTGQRESVITLPANQRQQIISPVNVQPPSSPAPDGFAPSQDEEEEGTDYMAMVKKYAPYVIGAVVLYYLILKNKK
jgi:hypothetical protein